jgi:hypothetical protein
VNGPEATHPHHLALVFLAPITSATVEGDLEVFNAFAFFKDPDGNGWAIQQGPARD